MYTMWFENNKINADTEKGETWDLLPKTKVDEVYGSLLYSLNLFSGSSSTVSTNQISKDFIITQNLPKNTNLTGKMIFNDIAHKNRFIEFVGGYDNTIRLYYDPIGKILPETQIAKAWYKEVVISSIEDGLRDTNTGLYMCSINLTTLSAVWRKDKTIASTIQGVVGEPHTIPFYYPYFYASDAKLLVNILNTGDRKGCKVEITNKGDTPLSRCNWLVKSDNNKAQYASFMNGADKLNSGRTLIVDSNPSNYRADVTSDGSETVSVRNLQEPSPQYINFVDIYNGNNQFSFDLGTTDTNVIDVIVSYTEEISHI